MALILAATAALDASDKVNVDSSGVILRGYDAVAYAKEEKPIKGKPELKSNYPGATYLFTSAANKAEFDRDPARYARNTADFVPTGSAWAYWVIRRDPQALVVHNGRLHICGNMASLEKFTEDIGRNIEKADKQWLRLSKL
jgi:YHS domain-containing protein